eukprot:3940823-Rhodomonas_salina.1
MDKPVLGHWTRKQQVGSLCDATRIPLCDAMRCPVLTLRIDLSSYAMSGTGIALCCAMSGTNIAHGRSVLCDVRY